MTRQVLSLEPLAPLEEAALELRLAGFHGAPVRDESGQLVGFVSTTDLLRRADDSQPPGVRAVEDVMSPVLFAVSSSEPAMYAAKRLIETGTHRLLVIDDAGQLCGIVSSTDFLRALLRGEDLLEGWEPSG
jgi:CBS domain-containing protein